MRRGEIRWYTFRSPDKRRPVLILARDEVAEVLNEVVVVPVTRTVRGLATLVQTCKRKDLPLKAGLADATALGRALTQRAFRGEL